MSNLVCYCFGYSESDIEQDVQNHNGQSTIIERIKASKQASQCRYHETIPFSFDSRRVGYMVSILSLETRSSFRFLDINSKIFHHIPEDQGIFDLGIYRVLDSPMLNKEIMFLI